MDRWICPSCSTRNKDTKLRCGICMRSRPKALLRAPAASSSSRPKTGTCTSSNDAGAVVDLTSSPHPTSGSGSGSGSTGGRRPSTESARSRKRRREREQESSGLGNADGTGGTNPATLVGNGVSVVSRKDADIRKRKTEYAAAAESPIDASNAATAWRTSSDKTGSIAMSSNDDLPKQPKKQETKKKSSSSSDKDSKRSASTMQQSTLFGKIVTDIREKDASTLPTTSRTTYDGSSNNAAAKKQGGEFASASVAATSSSTGNVFAEGRYQALKTKADRVMKETFRIHSLRNLQPQAIDGALRGQSQIVVMATGGGKSLCYQLPAVVLPGVTVVVSPLIALMQDQVQALNTKGIPAALYSSANGQRQNTEVLQRLVGKSSSKKGDKKKRTGSRSSSTEQPPPEPLKLIYCTPELIETDKFRAVLTDLYKRRELALFAVDEAHCLSTWGHDFRAAFRKLTYLRQTFRDVPVTACTATATPRVIADIRTILDLPHKSVPCHLGSFNRANITYEVRYKDNIDSTNPRGAMGDLTALIRQEHETAKASGIPASGIVYVHKRADASMLAQRICRESGVVARPYHAGLKDSERTSIQQQWTSGAVQVVW